ncbi:MAG: biotin transporter BioY [Candidatus Dormibacteraeota bacterium]|nr:biotin transporter BioY [Candidatus Dormibacteraeota bacterium]
MQSSTASPTLIRKWVSERGLAIDLGLVVSFALFTALMAQVSIPLPFTPVPITGQTFAVLLTGSLLGSRLGVSAMALYVAMGAIGLPFFAHGAHGFAIVTGVTGGYLIGFIVAGLVVGLLAERGWDRKLPHSAVAMLAGEVLIFTFGLLWLGYSLHWPANLLTLGLFPFLIGEAIKVAAAALVIPAGWRLPRA